MEAERGREKEEGGRRGEERGEGGGGEIETGNSRKKMKIYFQKTIFPFSLFIVTSGQEFLSISIHPFLLSFPPFPFRTPVLFLFTHVHTHTSLHTNTHMYT